MNRAFWRQTRLEMGETTASGDNKAISEDPRIKNAYLGA